MKHLIRCILASALLLSFQACASQSKVKIKGYSATPIAKHGQGDASTAEFTRVKTISLGEWLKVQKFAAQNGYDLREPEALRIPGNETIYQVTWWDAVKWCNAKSSMQGLTPVYYYRGSVFKKGSGKPEIDNRSNGYKWITYPNMTIAKINLY
jgi:hypothetical protein